MMSDENPATAEHARLAEATGKAEDDPFNANPWYEPGAAGRSPFFRQGPGAATPP